MLELLPRSPPAQTGKLVLAYMLQKTKKVPSASMIRPISGTKTDITPSLLQETPTSCGLCESSLSFPQHSAFWSWIAGTAKAFCCFGCLWCVLTLLLLFYAAFANFCTFLLHDSLQLTSLSKRSHDNSTFPL